MFESIAQAGGRIAVYRLGHLGDVLLCTGVLERLQKEFGYDFVFITRKTWTSLFDNHPAVSEVIGLDDSELSTPAFFAACGRIAGRFKGMPLLDLHGTLRSRLLSSLWNGPVARYPKMSLERRLFLASGHRLCGGKLRSLSVTQRYYMALSETVPPASELLPRLYPGYAESAAARARLDELFGEGLRPTALHPFATHPLKSWPAWRWHELAALLDGEKRPWIAIGRGKALFPERKEDLTNACSPRESAALLSHCGALVSGDSGPMHLASAVGTPVVALFGPTTREWGFYPAAEHDIVLENYLPCRPCSLHGGTACRFSGRCLAEIGPADVLLALGGITANAG